MAMVLYEKPLHIELVGANLFVNKIQHHKSVRLLSQMKKTLMKQIDNPTNPEMYYMYRNVYFANDLRYDITVLPALEVNGECTKTYGHYHPLAKSNKAYPEVYQILKGEAFFILQKKNNNGTVDVILVSGKEKDVILVPPGYGHVSINRGEGTLVLCNVVYDKFESIYSDFEENQGAAYYYLKGGEIVQNQNYIIQKSERMNPKEISEKYGFSCHDLLEEFHTNPKKFEFLEKPELLGK